MPVKSIKALFLSFQCSSQNILIDDKYIVPRCSENIINQFMENQIWYNSNGNSNQNNCDLCPTLFSYQIKGKNNNTLFKKVRIRGQE